MNTELKLINFEQIGNAIFLISTLFAFASGNQAKKHELEKLQGIPNSGSSSTGEKSAKLAYLSTFFTVAAYIIFTLVGVARKNSLEKDILSGTTNISLAPTIAIILGFVISLIGAVIRLPATQQSIREAQEVIL